MQWPCLLTAHLFLAYPSVADRMTSFIPCPYGNHLLHPYSHFANPNPNPNPNPALSPLLFHFPTKAPILYPRLKLPSCRNPTVRATTTCGEEPLVWLRVVAASAVFFLGLRVPVCFAASTPLLPSIVSDTQTAQKEEHAATPGTVGRLEDEELKAAFETWKSKTFALSVPLTIVALRASIPPPWIKVSNNLCRKFLAEVQSVFPNQM